MSAWRARTDSTISRLGSGACCSQHTIFQFAGTGWVPQSIDAFVNGTVAAVLAAHASLAPATLSVSAASVHNASINRSPTAYLLNPAAERAAYPTGDLDLEMVQLAVRDAAGMPRGLLNWHAVHGTYLRSGVD
jgi:neutral ceramidase